MREKYKLKHKIKILINDNGLTLSCMLRYSLTPRPLHKLFLLFRTHCPSLCAVNVFSSLGAWLKYHLFRVTLPSIPT